MIIVWLWHLSHGTTRRSDWDTITQSGLDWVTLFTTDLIPMWLEGGTNCYLKTYISVGGFDCSIRDKSSSTNYGVDEKTFFTFSKKLVIFQQATSRPTVLLSICYKTRLKPTKNVTKIPTGKKFSLCNQISSDGAPEQTSPKPDWKLKPKHCSGIPQLLKARMKTHSDVWTRLLLPHSDN